MKAKLIRRDNGEFYLIDENNKITSHHHLSKQNCNEIFGVVDVEGLADEYADVNGDYDGYYGHIGFKEGFKKATELNKDKVFTLEDIKKVFAKTIENSPSMESHTRMISNIEYRHFIMNKIYPKIIQSLQQPTEIEVEIEMETCSMNPLDLDCDEIIERIKLDSDECLILKKI